MRKIFFFFILSVIVAGCAKMDSRFIDGGWFDEEPPKVLGCFPADKSVNVAEKKISIVFDEYVKLENATENVIVSPPQIEQAEIKAQGKKIVVNLKDSLKPNTTYTVDFSDAISDNNEGNPLGNYTYSFSTGAAIDTLEVGGYVLDAETLEPIEGILVGLYEAEEEKVEADSAMLSAMKPDSVFMTQPFLRVARTDHSGHFVVKGVKEGTYKVYALQDQDNNFMLTPNSGEMMAFYEKTVKPWVFDDIRQDTTMLDSLRIKSIERVGYKHFMPDNVMLMAFKEPQTDRAFLKYERQNPDRFSLFFSYGDTLLPEIRGLNFDAENAFLIEKNVKQDSLTYWLRDTALVNTDSLEIEMTYRMTDTLGVLQQQTDTLLLLPKTTLAQRLHEKEKELKAWEKEQQKRKRRGQRYDSIMAPKPMKLNVKVNATHDPDRSIAIEVPAPLERIDSSMIHLYIERDSVWYNAQWELRQKENANARTMELLAEWQPECGYSLEIDSAAFVNIYGEVSGKIKKGFKIKSLDEYGTFEVTIPGMAGKNLIVQLLEPGEKLAREVFTDNGMAKFYYLAEKTYYMRLIVDDNNNKVWDTGRFADGRQPEQVYYYPKEINARAKWNLKETWNPLLKPRNEQKPGALKKGQGKKKKQQVGRNLRRAKELGIELPDYLK